jgi:hypothetical protein
VGRKRLKDVEEEKIKILEGEVTQVLLCKVVLNSVFGQPFERNGIATGTGNTFGHSCC